MNWKAGEEEVEEKPGVIGDDQSEEEEESLLGLKILEGLEEVVEEIEVEVDGMIE